jgi:predicted ArsR family transcriptional regulator
MASSTEATRDLFGPGLGETQRNLLLALKQRGPSTVATLSAELGLAATTLRSQLQVLAAQALVTREGRRFGKRGRPDVVFALGPEGERLFPRCESQVMGELVRHLESRRREDVLHEFFSTRAAMRAERLLPRVQGLRGVDRLREVARILTEEGFMARVDAGSDGRPVLHLCHCPIRGIVEETRLPCRFEEALLAQLLESPIARIDYLPDGGRACSYVERPASAASGPVRSQP